MTNTRTIYLDNVLLDDNLCDDEGDNCVDIEVVDDELYDYSEIIWEVRKVVIEADGKFWQFYYDTDGYETVTAVEVRPRVEMVEKTFWEVV